MNLEQFLVDVANGTGPVRWETWYPVSIEAQSRDKWAEAWRQLDIDGQYAVLERLHADGSVFADMLVQLAARHSEALDDLPVRQAMLADASDAGRRQLRALNAFKAELGASMEAAKTEQSEVLVSIAELEAQLAAFRSEHVGDDYTRMVALQQDVTRLQHQASALTAYDFDGEETLRQNLTDEIATLEARRASLEEEIGELRVHQAEIQRDVDSATSAVATHRAEAERLTREAESANSELETLSAQIAASSSERERVVSEHHELQRRADQMAEGLRRDRAALQELERSPVRAEAERIGAQIDELFAELPQDQADHRFGVGKSV